MSIVHSSLEGFETEVIEASDRTPILVDFWADWCAPCRVIAPVLERLAADLRGRLSVVKLEVDQGENMKLAGRYRLRGFPTVVLFHRGAELGRFSGARSRADIVDFLEAHLGGVYAR